ncbi:MAG: PAS domain S-box protein [Deltaproteobacteria bacterium]|nr:MAG: PAS domain S-box protein [Deltaproteobacteria bacterium]
MASFFAPRADSAQTRRLLVWYLGIRLAVVVFFLGGATIYHLRAAHGMSPALVVWLGTLVAVATVQTVISALILVRLGRFERFIHGQLTWDLLFSLAVIYLTGGVESLYTFLFILVIVAASVFLPRPQLLIVTSAAAILYGSLLDLQYYRYLPMFGGQDFPTRVRAAEVFYAVFIHVGAFFLTALLSGYLAERVRRSEAAREQREIDYGDLEQLNRAILVNITSGLMLVSPEGRIRSFNQAAARITGYRLEEVYNRPVEIFFPPFAALDHALTLSLQRGEAVVKTSRGNELILGYSASHVRDPQERDLGLLVAFQDLTEVKALEEQLRRADRLAAVGRLASGLAHEIRNPLASISGSVQLLREDAGIGEENRRLMGIVIREVDRLNLLLSDFLNFARPAPLQPECVDIAGLFDELVELLRAGGQASSVRFETCYEPSVIMRVDRQKLRQAVWDLLINAVEALPSGGTVRISANAAAGEIRIEDSGAGIAPEAKDRVFEPFFTTKDRGTGLGLANVYANIDAHRGRIFVEPSPLGGACFMIELPEECRQDCTPEH